jgi:hypothetical protein
MIFIKELERVKNIVFLQSAETIYNENINEDELTLTDKVCREVSDNILRLNSIDFIIPYLKQFTYCNFSDFDFPFSSLANRKFFESTLSSNIHSCKINANREEFLTYQSFALFNQISRKMITICRNYEIDYMDILAHFGYDRFYDERFSDLGWTIGNEDQDDILNNINQKNTFFSHKQEILLLEKIGFFDLPDVKDLTLESKGALVSTILKKNHKNCKIYISNLAAKNKRTVSMDKDFVYTEQNIKRVDDFLNELKT